MYKYRDIILLLFVPNTSFPLQVISQTVFWQFLHKSKIQIYYNKYVFLHLSIFKLWSGWTGPNSVEWAWTGPNIIPYPYRLSHFCYPLMIEIKSKNDEEFQFVLKGTVKWKLISTYIMKKDLGITVDIVKMMKKFVFILIFNFFFKIFLPIVTQIRVRCP